MDINEAPSIVKVESVLNTIPLLTIAPTYDNVNRLTGIYNALFAVRDSLAEGGKDDAGSNPAE